MSISIIGSSAYAARKADETYIGLVESDTFDSKFGDIVKQRSTIYRSFAIQIIGAEIEEIITERDLQRKIVITEHGSAGRSEKGNSSKIDIIVSGSASNIVSYVADKLRTGKLKDLFLEIDERPYGESSVLYFDKERKLTFPCRTIDSTNLFKLPSSDLECNNKKRLLQELQGELSRVLDHIKARRRTYKKIIKDNGVQVYRGEPLRHFNLDEGTMMYAGDNQKLGSFKLSALRYTQNAIVHDIMKFTGDTRFTPELFENLPQNTAEKLLFLSDHKISQLNIKEVEELIQLYEYFLWLYHKSQYSFRKNKETQVAIPDPKLTRENLNDLLKLTEKGIIQF